jgi:hypothetical protein
VPKGVMIVQTGCDPSREDEYNDWYSNTHIPEVLAVPGFVGARRYKVHQPAVGAPPSHAYLSVYEIEAEELTAPMQELRARSAAGQTTPGVGMQTDPPPVVTLYELID